MAVLDSAKVKGGIRSSSMRCPVGRSRHERPRPVRAGRGTRHDHLLGSDYYEIALVQYTEKLSRDVPATTLRGYVQLETAANLAHSKHIALKYPTAARSWMPALRRSMPSTSPSTWDPRSSPRRTGRCASSSPTTCPPGPQATCSCRSTPPSWAPGKVRSGLRVETTRRTAPPFTCTVAPPPGSATARRTNGPRRSGRPRPPTSAVQRAVRARHVV